MRMFELTGYPPKAVIAGIVAIAGLVVALAVAPAMAFDPLKSYRSDENPLDVMRFGLKAYKDGRKDEAAGAFRYAAERNQLAAKWKLGRMHAEGDGIRRDDLAAFHLYSEIADEYSAIRPKRQDRGFVSSAIVAVADYHRQGIEGTKIKPDLRRAVDYYVRAAALYGNSDAQYQLGVIYLSGKLNKPQPILAARWLRAASKKHHPAAQAVLGRMLIDGNGVKRRRIQGLVLMSLAVGNNARGKINDKFRWISEWREKAFSRATSEEQMIANELAIKRFASTTGLSLRDIAAGTGRGAAVSFSPEN